MEPQRAAFVAKYGAPFYEGFRMFYLSCAEAFAANRGAEYMCGTTSSSNGRAYVGGALRLRHAAGGRRRLVAYVACEGYPARPIIHQKALYFKWQKIEAVSATPTAHTQGTQLTGRTARRTHALWADARRARGGGG